MTGRSGESAELSEVLRRITADGGCRLLPPSGVPAVASEHRIPDDVLEFYRVAGGAALFPGSNYDYSIVGPEEVRPANRVLRLDPEEGDISEAWYIIAVDSGGEYLTIDLDSTRLGKCYDSFHETHGLVGSMPIVARSFTELLQRLLDNRGDYPYWLRDDFTGMGDAYDDAE